MLSVFSTLPPTIFPALLSVFYLMGTVDTRQMDLGVLHCIRYNLIKLWPHFRGFCHNFCNDGIFN